MDIKRDVRSLPNKPISHLHGVGRNKDRHIGLKNLGLSKVDLPCFCINTTRDTLQNRGMYLDGPAQPGKGIIQTPLQVDWSYSISPRSIIGVKQVNRPLNPCKGPMSTEEITGTTGYTLHDEVSLFMLGRLPTPKGSDHDSIPLRHTSLRHRAPHTVGLEAPVTQNYVCGMIPVVRLVRCRGQILAKRLVGFRSPIGLEWHYTVSPMGRYFPSSMGIIQTKISPSPRPRDIFR
ncbi:hypothetical protein J6590_038327 [Homalodisca vitripennis]|nr:hypothetical protein J6590_038327 [Homalodisca vitripennis]